MNRLYSVTRLHGIVMMLFACALTAAAQGAAPPADARGADEAAVRENVRQMEEGWNTKSGALFARPFAEDADYVVINGMSFRGRAAIAETHQRIFETIFKDSTISLSVKQLRFLRPDVAVAHINGRNRTRASGEEREVEAIITLVMVREAGAWKIAAFQNTQVAR
jgi:uncharacterized protein (TIGR02246 family)